MPARCDMLVGVAHSPFVVGHQIKWISLRSTISYLPFHYLMFSLRFSSKCVRICSLLLIQCQLKLLLVVFDAVECHQSLFAVCVFWIPAREETQSTESAHDGLSMEQICDVLSSVAVLHARLYVYLSYS